MNSLRLPPYARGIAAHRALDRLGWFGLAPALLLASCASGGPRPASVVEGTSPRATVQAQAHGAGDYFEIAHAGRIYLVGSAASYAESKDEPHLPYSHSRVGAGPAGETVIVELDPKDPSLQERLWAEYTRRHLFYGEVHRDGRIYVVGSERSLGDFQETHHLAYTRSVLGYGPQGATVVFELDPKNDALGLRLQREFDRRHRYYAEEHRDGRIYVIGARELHGEFLVTGHLPYTASLIGRGPGRETLVFQVDPKDERLAERLRREFASRHGLTL